VSIDTAALIKRAASLGVTIATAESCTGGMIAAALTDIAGSSAAVDRGYVTYSNRAKMEMLGVRTETLDAHGAVSEEVANEMAAGALNRGGVALAVSVTGIAGPGGSEFKPEGRVCFGLARTGQRVVTETVEFGAIGRDRVRAATRDHALDLLMQALSHIEQEAGSPPD
jgi:nicotinamide-nucleotide amidase